MTPEQEADRKQRLIEHHRDINVGWSTEWWDGVYEIWTEKMKKAGIDATDMAFSGFWSQGDGASFLCSAYGKEVSRFMRRHALVREFPGIWFWARRKYQRINITSQRAGSNYCHANTVSVEAAPDWDFEVPVDDPEELDLREQLLVTMGAMADAELSDFDKRVEDICRNYMRDFYADLEKEHDYLTSDEAVWESILANDLEADEYDFDEDYVDDQVAA
jgi:hypothetical protein